MKVKELIKVLEKSHPECEVIMSLMVGVDEDFMLDHYEIAYVSDESDEDEIVYINC